MKDKPITPRTMDEYIAGFPSNVQKILKKIRTTIRKAAPAADETIKYQMPTFTLRGNLISFAVYKNHIGLYPAPSGSEKFNRELSAYGAEKSTVRFALDRPIPFELISKIVKLRIKKNLEKSKAKGTKRNNNRDSPKKIPVCC